MRGGAPHVCAHCSRTETPCWRRGPPEKPILCNACGSRWLIRKSLEGYMPGAAKAGGGERAHKPPVVTLKQPAPGPPIGHEGAASGQLKRKRNATPPQQGTLVPTTSAARTTPPPHAAPPQLHQHPPQAGAASSQPAQQHGVQALTPQQQAFLAAFAFPTALLQASIMSSATSRPAGFEPPGQQQQLGASTTLHAAAAAAATSSSSSLPPPGTERLDRACKGGSFMAASSSQHATTIATNTALASSAERELSYREALPQQRQALAVDRQASVSTAPLAFAFSATPLSLKGSMHLATELQHRPHPHTPEHPALPTMAAGTASGGTSAGAAAGAVGGGGARRPRKQARPVSCC